MITVTVRVVGKLATAWDYRGTLKSV